MLRRTLVAVAGALALTVAPASAQTWAPAGTATVKPGVMTFTGGQQCTANFVFRDTGTGDVFIGQAAHCSGTDGNTATNGCTARSMANGTAVEIDGASRPGTMVYNSWLAMQAAGETDRGTCLGNDFALVRIDPADVARVNPSVPFWGGPNGIGTSATGQKVYTYGNSSLRLGFSPLSPKAGLTTGSGNGGWSWNLYTASPGIPGDSGSAFLNASGAALGVLSTLEALPRPGSNNVSDVGRALAYARAHGFPNVVLVDGTEPFDPIL